MKRKICVITGTRADYGLLRYLMFGIVASENLVLQVIATGMHLSPEFGLTYREIERDGFNIDARIETQVSSDTPVGLTKSVGLGVIGFADAFDRLVPDIVVVLGDRFEIFAATQAAFFAGISVAHISGGEVTVGALDDAMRHSITKMARYHFVAAQPYAKRVMQLGEPPENVFNVGDPGLDNLARLSLLEPDELGAEIGLDLAKPYFLVTYHPTVISKDEMVQSMQALLQALDAFPGVNVLFTKSNADVGGRILNAMIDTYAAARPGRVMAAMSLGQLRYLSAMKHCAAVVGNSSSGIVEAPGLGIPTVNVGKRQDGRLRASSIIDCAEDFPSVKSAISRALSQEFRTAAAGTQSLYGNCDASTQILNKLAELNVDRNFVKIFHDVAP